MSIQKLKTKGLLNRFKLEKTDGTPIQDDAEYFTLRLDMGGRDQEYIKACRKAINVLADELKDHSPLLSKEIKEKWPII